MLDAHGNVLPDIYNTMNPNFCSASTETDIDHRRPLQPAHAVSLISFSALNASPLFRTAKVIAAIQRAIVTLANS